MGKEQIAYSIETVSVDAEKRNLDLSKWSLAPLTNVFLVDYEIEDDHVAGELVKIEDLWDKYSEKINQANKDYKMKLTQILKENQKYDIQHGLPQELEIGDTITNHSMPPVFIVRGKDREGDNIVYTAFSDRAYRSGPSDEDGEYIDLKFTIENGKLIPLPAYKDVI